MGNNWDKEYNVLCWTPLTEKSRYYFHILSSLFKEILFLNKKKAKSISAPLGEPPEYFEEPYWTDAE